jgi:hypothetical protein
MTSKQIAEGYSAAGSTGDAQDWQKRSKAALFKYDASMERLLKMRDTDPDRFERRTPLEKRVAMGYYASAKDAAEAIGIDTNPPKEAA